jgi:hypothetical protein
LRIIVRFGGSVVVVLHCVGLDLFRFRFRMVVRCQQMVRYLWFSSYENCPREENCLLKRFVL